MTASWSINQWRVQCSFPSLNRSRNPSQKYSGHRAMLIQLAYHCCNCHISWSAAWWQWVETTCVWRSKAGCLWRASVFRSELLSTSVDLEKASKLSPWLCMLQLPTVSRDMNCMKIHTHVYIKDGPCPQSTYNLTSKWALLFTPTATYISP